MSLIDSMMVPCMFMEPKRTPDCSGGHTPTWEEGKRFNAAIVRDTSTEARIAEAAGTVERFTVTTSRAVSLEFHAVFKRLSDGKTFRITSGNAEKCAPTCSRLDIAQATAEAWRLTK